MGLNKGVLIHRFNKAIESGYHFIGLSFYIEGFPEDEVIINGRENFKKKLDYYLETYDDNLVHKYSKSKVVITGCAFGDSYDEIQADLVD